MGQKLVKEIQLSLITSGETAGMMEKVKQVQLQSIKILIS